MKGKILALLAVLMSLLLSSSEARKFKEETRNKALKNTRRVQ